MTRQLPLAITLRPQQRLSDFVPGPNTVALAALRQLLDTPGPNQVYLSGPVHVGKSHLLAGLCGAAEQVGLSTAFLPLSDHAQLDAAMLDGLESYDLLALDDVDAIAGIAPWEAALFALYNRARDAGRRLVVTAACGPAQLAIALPDLRSRLAWGQAYHLKPLDDDGKRELLIRAAAARGLTLNHDVARYVLDRAPRDLPSLLALMNRLDDAALAAQRGLTLPFVREHLASSQE